MPFHTLSLFISKLFLLHWRSKYTQCVSPCVHTVASCLSLKEKKSWLLCVRHCLGLSNLSHCCCCSSVEISSVAMNHVIFFYLSQVLRARLQTTSLNHPRNVWWKCQRENCVIGQSMLSYLKSYFWISNYPTENLHRLLSGWVITKPNAIWLIF